VRKVKITLNPGSPGKKFYLFPTPESLYLWIRTLEGGEKVSIDGIEELTLEPEPAGFIEAELVGFEYVYDGGLHHRLDLIRLGKAEQPQNSSGLLVSIHSGWVSGGLFPLRRYSDADIDIKPITVDESRLDLAMLFEVGDNAKKSTEGEPKR